MLGGLFLGDNVVFEVADPRAAEPFYRAVAAAAHYDERVYVNVSGDRPAVAGFDLIEAGARGELGQPAPLMRAIVESCRGERNLILFETMETMIERWGSEVAARCFAICCPQFLDIGAVALRARQRGRPPPGGELPRLAGGTRE